MRCYLCSERIEGGISLKITVARPDGTSGPARAHVSCVRKAGTRPKTIQPEQRPAK